MEQFIDGYGGDYLINSDGVITSLKLGKYFNCSMKQRKDKDGYHLINLCLSGKKITEKVHRLVAKAFLPNPYNLPEVNHIDGNKSNNSVSNLEWCDNSHNKYHAYKSGLRRSRRGETNKNRMKVAQLDANGKLIKVYNGIVEAEKELGINGSNISTVLNNDKRVTAGGYKWEKMHKTLQP